MNCVDNKNKWEGYEVHGDPSELDYIVEHSGFISLGRQDLVDTLSAGGDTYVSVGQGESLASAFSDAFGGLPDDGARVQKLVIQFYADARQPSVAELKTVTVAVTKSAPYADVMWGIMMHPDLGEVFKVTLVASLATTH